MNEPSAEPSDVDTQQCSHLVSHAVLVLALSIPVVMLPNILLNFRGCTEIFSSLDPFPVFSLVEYFYTPCIFKALCEHKMKNMQMIDNHNQERKKVSEKEGRCLVCSHRRRVCAFSKLIYKMLRYCCQPPCPLRTQHIRVV